VAGRSSDNTLITRLLGWAPTTPLEEGLEHTYRWIYDSMAKQMTRQSVVQGLCA
jgi:GDP-D-mannose 3',5'-epimerase